MAALSEIVIDCEHAPSLARFWAAVLDDYDVLPYDDAEIARLAALGLTPETDPTVAVSPASPPPGPPAAAGPARPAAASPSS